MPKLVSLQATYIGGRLVAAGVGFAAILMYSHIVEAAVFGEYAAYLAIATLVDMVAFNWLRSGMTRFTASGDAPKARYLGIAVTLASAVAVAILVMVLGIFSLWGDTSVLIVGAMIVAASASSMHLEYLRANGRASSYSLQSVFRQVCIVALSIALLQLHVRENPIAIGFILGNLLSIVPFLRRRDIRELAFGRSGYSEFLRYGLPLSLSFGLSGVMNSADRLIVIGILGKEAGGVYSLSADIATRVVMTVMEGANLAAFPKAVRALEKDGVVAALAVSDNNVLLLMGLAVPVAFGLAACAPAFAALVIGAEYAPLAATLVPLLALYVLFRGLRVFYLDQAFQLAKRTERAVAVAAVAAGLTVLCSLLFTLYFGVYGAAVGATLAALGAAVVSRLLGRMHLPLRLPVSGLAKILVSATLMAWLARVICEAWPTPIGLIAAVIAGVGAYGILLLLLNGRHLLSTMPASND